MYTIYKHTVPNGKVYIGQTKLTTYARWASGSGYQNQRYFYTDILKFGWRNIQHEILAEVETKEEATALERKYILECRSNEPEYGYNKNINTSSLPDDEKRKIYKEKYRNNTDKKKKVRCIETGDEFYTLEEAAKTYNISASGISKACRGCSKTSGGYHWEKLI